MAGRTGGALALLTLSCLAPPAWAQDAPPEPPPASAPSPTPAQESSTPSAAPADASTPTPTSADATPQTPEPKQKKKRRLLDLNKDGKVNTRDALRIAGLSGRFDSVVRVGGDGRLGVKSPYKLLGDALLDLADDGKLTMTHPSQLVGVQLANFNNYGKVSYRNRRVTLTRTWRF